MKVLSNISSKKILIFSYVFSIVLQLSIIYFLLFKSDNQMSIHAFSILFLIAAIVMSIILILNRKLAYKNKILNSTIVLVIISSIFYIFPTQSLGLFIKNTGILNYTIYAGKILYITLPLAGFEIYSKLSIIKCDTKNIIKKITLFIIKPLLLFFILLLTYKTGKTTNIFWAIPALNVVSTILYTLINIRLKKF